MSINTRLNKLLKQAKSVPFEKPQIEEVTKIYIKALFEINNELGRIYLKFGDEAKLSDLYQYKRLTAIKARIKSILRTAEKGMLKTTKQAIEGNFKQQYDWDSYAYTEVFENGAGIKTNFAKFSPALTISSVKNPKDKITGYIFKQMGEDGNWFYQNSLKEYHRKAFRVVDQEITKGLLSGKGYKKTAREIRKKLFGKKKHQFNMIRSMERIIRTESQKARNLADVIAYDDLKEMGGSDIELKRIWIATFDERVRDSHISANNQVENKDGKFFIEGVETDAPTLSGVASIDINCRCTTGVEVVGLKSTFDESKAAKNLSPSGFKAWQNSQRKVA